MSIEHWEKIYRNIDQIKPGEASWLDKYTDIFSEVPEKPVIDLGCGPGGETVYLLGKEYSVISCDFCSNVLDKLAAYDSRVTTKKFDIMNGLPFGDGEAHVVLASLCLHYFSTDATRRVLADIARVLDADGYLICRLNSVNDLNHGAGEGIEVEKNYYNQNGNFKRFFDTEMINEFFSGWEILRKQETVIKRFKNEKKAWEVTVRKIQLV